MTRERRHAMVCVGVLAAGACLELVLGRMLAGRDVLAALVARLDVFSLGLLLVALALRLFLVLCGPGWLLYATLNLIAAERRRKLPS